MDDPKVAVAQGMSIAIDPTLRKMGEYVYWYAQRAPRYIPYTPYIPYDLGSNICKTDLIRKSWSALSLKETK
jgi:hypothetical protein